MHLGNLLTPMLKSISKGSGEAVFSLSIFNVTIWVQYLITSFIYLLGMNYIDAAMRKQDSNLGRFSSGRVMLPSIKKQTKRSCVSEHQAQQL